MQGANVITRARVSGQMRSYQDAGIEYYEILEPMDERTCPICREMNGKLFPVSEGTRVTDKLLSAEDPEEVKEIAPWVESSRDIMGKEPKELISSGILFPPFHFHCRGTTVAHMGPGSPGAQDTAERGNSIRLRPEWEPETIRYSVISKFGIKFL